MISREMARKNGLKVGSTFTAYGKALTVAGIFESNTQQGNNTVIASLPALQQLGRATRSSPPPSPPPRSATSPR